MHAGIIVINYSCIGFGLAFLAKIYFALSRIAEELKEQTRQQTRQIDYVKERDARLMLPVTESEWKKIKTLIAKETIELPSGDIREL